MSAAEPLTEQLPAPDRQGVQHQPRAGLGRGPGRRGTLDVLLATDDDAAKSRVSELVAAAGLQPIDVGGLDNARLLERLTAFQIELSQRYGLDYRLTFKLLLPHCRVRAAVGPYVGRGSETRSLWRS
jgi:predicted dinucleotide-binding enzyme